MIAGAGGRDVMTVAHRHAYFGSAASYLFDEMRCRFVMRAFRHYFRRKSSHDDNALQWPL